MAVTNALNAEPGVTCTHEGKFRHREAAGKQVLRFLTLENRLAYEKPGDAAALFAARRGDLREVADATGGRAFGDIAYNYAPFMDAIFALFPSAPIIVFFRNGVDFVRSAAESDGEDAAPVGWPPKDKPLTDVERYVSLGRLAPRAGSALDARWPELDQLERNAWLWAETNRLIVDALARRPAHLTHVIRFEEFFRDPFAHYASLHQFLGLNGVPSPAALATFSQPINARRQKLLGPPSIWLPEQRASFCKFAGPMMERLGYALPNQSESSP